MGEQLDAPNQQVVRPDGSHPADEGEGGSTRDDDTTAREADEDTTADEKQKQSKSKTTKATKAGEK